MKVDVIMPQLGETIFAATITRWLKQAGDRVTRDEPLFEVSTDKVDSEIPSPADGLLSEIFMPEGKTVQVGTIIATITINDNDDEAGPSVANAEMENKEPVNAAAQAEEEKTPAAMASDQAASPKPDIPSVEPKEIRTSPLVRQMAREHGIDLSVIRGTGREGRITRDDLMNHLAKDTVSTRPTPEPVPLPAIVEAPAGALDPAPIPIREPQPGMVETPGAAFDIPERPRFQGESETVAMTPMRKTIAERMVHSRQVSAHVTTVFEADVTSIVGLRERHNAEFEEREGIALTFTPFFAKALVDAVREYPIVNSSVESDSIVLKKSVNLGVAIALPAGLIVPVVKDAQLKSFSGLALAIHDLAGRARSKRLKPDEVQDGTISITNPGSYGALFQTPIISQPQVAILGVGGIEKRPVIINDAIAIRSMVYLALSFDHRVIDGAVADQFMARLKHLLQEWTDWVE